MRRNLEELQEIDSNNNKQPSQEPDGQQYEMKLPQEPTSTSPGTP